MSEENQTVDSQPIEKPQENKDCKYKTLLTLVIVSLIMSIASLTLSILGSDFNFAASDGANGKQVVISKQYDKGKSMDKAKATGKPILVFFYTDWCHFCQSFAPTFNKITKDSKIKRNFAVAYVNCEKPENRAIMEEYKVQGFPTVFVIKTDGSKTQLDNNTFFNPDSVDTVKAKALELIGEE